VEDGFDVSAAPRPVPTEIEASFVVLGPRNEGSNYGIITHSPGLSIDNATRQLLEDYALMTLAAAPRPPPRPIRWSGRSRSRSRGRRRIC